jgi:hypothetical protein
MSVCTERVACAGAYTARAACAGACTARAAYAGLQLVQEQHVQPHVENIRADAACARAACAAAFACARVQLVQHVRECSMSDAAALQRRSACAGPRMYNVWDQAACVRPCVHGEHAPVVHHGFRALLEAADIVCDTRVHVLITCGTKQRVCDRMFPENMLRLSTTGLEHWWMPWQFARRLLLARPTCGQRKQHVQCV